MDAPAPIEPEMVEVRYRDAHGFLQEVRVSSTLARAIRNVRQQARRADERWRARHRPLTDLEVEAEVLVAQARPRLAAADGSPWEGPRIGFLLLLGLAIPWPPPRPGQGQACPGCGDRPLAPIAACLICNSTGMDAKIPRPTAAELRLKRTRKPRADDGLSGGTGGTTATGVPASRPDPKPTPAPPRKPRGKATKPPRPKAQWLQEYEAMRGAAKGEPTPS